MKMDFTPAPAPVVSQVRVIQIGGDGELAEGALDRAVQIAPRSLRRDPEGPHGYYLQGGKPRGFRIGIPGRDPPKIAVYGYGPEIVSR